MSSSLTWITLTVLAGCLMAAQQPGSVFAQSNPTIVIETSAGSITAELFQDKAPKSVENFLAYAKTGFYNGTIFHRVIKKFMIQGGGITAEMVRKQTREPIVNEAGNGLKNTRGTLAMARTSEINSATAQFFINTVDNAFLDHKNETQDGFGYAVFGKVIAGMDVVDKIEAGKTGANDIPIAPVAIKSVVVQQ